MENKLVIMILFIIVSITWGTTFIAIKIAINTIPPIFATSMRFLLMSPILIGMSYYTNTPLLFPDKKKIFQLFICIFYFTIPFSLMLYGGTYVNSEISSIIFATMPNIVMLLSVFFLKKKYIFYKILD
nr:DMT family transporter [Buchnera aphidicola]